MCYYNNNGQLSLQLFLKYLFYSGFSDDNNRKKSLLGFMYCLKDDVIPDFIKAMRRKVCYFFYGKQIKFRITAKRQKVLYIFVCILKQHLNPNKIIKSSYVLK